MKILKEQNTGIFPTNRVILSRIKETERTAKEQERDLGRNDKQKKKVNIMGVTKDGARGLAWMLREKKERNVYVCVHF